MDSILSKSFDTISNMVRRQAANRPSHPALIQDNRTVTHAELDTIMDRVAASLQRDGVLPRDIIAICADNLLDYVTVFLGSVRAGVTVAPLSPAWGTNSLGGMLRDAEAKKVFVDKSGMAALASIFPSARLVALDDTPGVISLSQWLTNDTMLQPVEVKPDWPFNIIYSSGTTGTPKGIVQPHIMRWGNVKRGVMNEFGTDSVLLVAIPFYSNLTLINLFASVALGGTAILMRKFAATDYLELAQRYRVTHTALVPVQYQRIIADPDFSVYDLSSFRLKTCAGAPFAASLKAEVVKLWPGKLIEYYGMTEGGAACYLPAEQYPDKLHTIGMPAPECEIRLIDDDGKEVPRGEPGEIVGRSPLMMSGYFKLPEKTAEVEWFDEAGKRFIRTGDIGRFDEDGFITLLDRKKDMIISGGFNVYPSDIEAVLRDHSDIVDVTVVGVPSQQWGESAVAFVVLRSSSNSVSGDIITWANERLSKSQRLQAVEVVKELPRSHLGKVLKRQLRDDFMARS